VPVRDSLDVARSTQHRQAGQDPAVSLMVFVEEANGPHSEP